MRFRFLKEHRNFIKKNYKGITTFELTALFNEEFKTNITRPQIKAYLIRNRLCNGVIKRFEKGQIPKGYKPVGSERNINGYIEIKIADPNKWYLKHYYIYEEKFGEIPDGFVLFFLDQNRQNVGLDNLALISKYELLILNQQPKSTNNKDINSTKILIAKIKSKYYELLRNRSDIYETGRKTKI